MQVILETYTAWNRGDLGVLEGTPPDFEFHSAQLFTGNEALYRGREGMERLWRNLFSTWTDMRIHVERIEELGDRVLVLLVSRATNRESGAKLVHPVAHMLDFDGERPLRVVEYGSWGEAIRAAGLSA